MCCNTNKTSYPTIICHKSFFRNLIIQKFSSIVSFVLELMAHIYALFVFVGSEVTVTLLQHTPLHDAGLRPRSQAHIGELLWRIVGMCWGRIADGRQLTIKWNNRPQWNKMLHFMVRKGSFSQLFTFANFTIHWYCETRWIPIKYLEKCFVHTVHPKNQKKRFFIKKMKPILRTIKIVSIVKKKKNHDKSSTLNTT